MNDHKFPNWFKHYADQFVPKNRCTYCWWVRGGIAHAVIWDILVSMLIEHHWPALAWFLRIVAIVAIVYLQIFDNYNRELKNAGTEKDRGVSDGTADAQEQSG